MRFASLSLDHSQVRGAFVIEGSPSELVKIEKTAEAMAVLMDVDIAELSVDDCEAFCTLTYDKYVWTLAEMRAEYASIKDGKNNH